MIIIIFCLCFVLAPNVMYFDKIICIDLTLSQKEIENIKLFADKTKLEQNLDELCKKINSYIVQDVYCGHLNEKLFIWKRYWFMSLLSLLFPCFTKKIDQYTMKNAMKTYTIFQDNSHATELVISDAARIGSCNFRKSVVLFTPTVTNSLITLQGKIKTFFTSIDATALTVLPGKYDHIRTMFMMFFLKKQGKSVSNGAVCLQVDQKMKILAMNYTLQQDGSETTQLKCFMVADNKYNESIETLMDLIKSYKSTKVNQQQPVNDLSQLQHNEYSEVCVGIIAITIKVLNKNLNLIFFVTKSNKFFFFVQQTNEANMQTLTNYSFPIDAQGVSDMMKLIEQIQSLHDGDKQLMTVETFQYGGEMSK